MSKRNILAIALVLCSGLIGPGADAQDEMGLFTTLSPDALILLDLSGSMRYTPAGKTMYISDAFSCSSGSNIPFYGESGPGHTQPCSINPYDSVPKYSNGSCSGPFYRIPVTGYTADCSRVAIAKRAIFDILDDNNSNLINSQDEKSLSIRLGYMRFIDCSSDDGGGSYSSGCNKLLWGIGSKYSRIYCNNGTSCSPTSSASGSVSGETANEGTPLAAALNEAKLYLDAHKSTDPAASCRSKFVILITDGADTFTCGGNGTEDQPDQYKRRRAVAARAKALADAGYKVFVVGFGADMPHFLRNTLNWMAYHGGTDNPLVANSGSITSYDPSSTVLCQDSPTTEHNIEGDGNHYYALANDPGEILLSGYAFLATNSQDLTTALKQAVYSIREALYSFATPSITSFRTQDENYLYEASFLPVGNDPFWRGHLKKYSLNTDGTLGAVLWDAGSVLQTTLPDNRNILTFLSGVLTPFNASNVNKGVLGAATDAERDQIVGYFRGDPAYNPDDWKLGDIFHSSPVTVGTPSKYFNDLRDANGGFATFRANHPRTSGNEQRVVLASANDGQIHAFRASDGVEVWSFIPPNLLPKLKNIAHGTHPVGYTHQYFVDGSITVADTWLGSGDGTGKSAFDWMTLLILGEGRGGSPFLWSSSPHCDSGWNARYTVDYPYYCGYYAFNLTNTASPVFKWRIQASPDQAPYLADSWSKVAIGRVKINGNEKWVGFFGGGYNASDCADGTECDLRGKGFLVVDLSNGAILWSFTRAQNSSMNYSLVASPVIVDTDYDGFIDTAYVGDLGGNMWRFKFCTTSDGPTCNTSQWIGGQLFEAPSGTDRPIYMMAAVTKDRSSNLWVAWGTGDKTDPLATGGQDRFFAIKDNDRSTIYPLGNLENITSTVYHDLPAQKGWYINLASGEKVLTDPAIFGSVLYFTSYTPDQSGNPCSQAGTGKMYGIALMSLNIDGIPYSPGAGVITPPADPTSKAGGFRSMVIGTGIPSTPVISFKPSGALPPDIYVTTSGGAGMMGSTMRVNFNPPAFSNRTNMLSWEDRRLR